MTTDHLLSKEAIERQNTYYAKDGMVWKAPVKTRNEIDNSTSISIGFPVCKMHEAAGDAAAETVAQLMNAGEAALTTAKRSPPEGGDEVEGLIKRAEEARGSLAGWRGHPTPHVNIGFLLDLIGELAAALARRQAEIAELQEAAGIFRDKYLRLVNEVGPAIIARAEKAEAALASERERADGYQETIGRAILNLPAGLRTADPNDGIKTLRERAEKAEREANRKSIDIIGWTEIAGAHLCRAKAAEAKADALKRAVEPFAKVAAPFSDEHDADQTPLNKIIGKEGTDELYLHCPFSERDTHIVLWAEDFREAAKALTAAQGEGEAPRQKRDRPAKNPGGCECMKCGAIFIGEEWHTECAICAESAPSSEGHSAVKGGERLEIAKALHARFETRRSCRDLSSSGKPEPWASLSPGSQRDFLDDADAVLATLRPSPVLQQSCFECDTPLEGPYCPRCNPVLPLPVLREAVGALEGILIQHEDWHDDLPGTARVYIHPICTWADLRRARSVHAKLKARMTGGDDGK